MVNCGASNRSWDNSTPPATAVKRKRRRDVFLGYAMRIRQQRGSAVIRAAAISIALSIGCMPVFAHAQSAELRASPLYQAVEAGSKSRRDVRLLQRLLALQGYNPGLIDGIFGTKTQVAIAQWQRDTGQRVHGLGLAPGEVAELDAPRRCTNVAQNVGYYRIGQYGGACR